MNSENSRTSEYHELVFRLADKLDLKKRSKRCCFIKSIYLLHMEKCKKKL